MFFSDRKAGSCIVPCARGIAVLERQCKAVMGLAGFIRGVVSTQAVFGKSSSEIIFSATENFFSQRLLGPLATASEFSRR